MNKEFHNIKQNKKIVAIFVATMVLVAFISMPSLAYSDTSINGIDFSDQPFSMAQYSSESNSLDVGSSFLLWFTSDAEYYVGLVSIGSLYRPEVIYNNNSGSGGWWYNRSSGTWSHYSQSAIGDLPGYYYNYIQTNYSFSDISSTTIPIFNSSADFVSAVKDWIENPPTPAVEPRAINYTIPAGYAFVADITGLTPTGMVKTGTSKAYSSPHVSNQTIAYVDSIPTIGSNPIGNGISWDGVGNKDLFGRYKSWQHNLVPNPSKNYLVVYNPVHIDNYVDPEHEDYNSSIVISLSEARSGQLIALNTELTSSGQVGTVTTDNTGNITYDNETDSWVTTNPDGSPYNPSPYGDYLPNTQNSIHDWLENISNQISGFFNGAIGAITNLVSAGSSFFQVLLGLYSWLPISVLSVLSSALIIVITIGVIKVFL